MFEGGRYPQGLRAHAVTMVFKRLALNPKDRTIYREVAAELNVGEQSLRLWVKKASEHLASQQGTSSIDPDPGGEKLEIDALRRQVQHLKAENDLLKRAFVVFSTDWATAPVDRKMSPEPEAQDGLASGGGTVPNE